MSLNLSSVPGFSNNTARGKDSKLSKVRVGLGRKWGNGVR